MKIIPLIILVSTFSLSNSFSQEYAYGRGELAVGGYDITSYFDEDLKKGKKEFKSTYLEVVYLFANQENKKKFESNPTKYIPAYGGWCAMALCQGKLVQPNPKLYSIIDDKIHLFEVKVFYNGKAEWFKDPDKNKSAANEKYKAVVIAENE